MFEKLLFSKLKITTNSIGTGDFSKCHRYFYQIEQEILTRIPLNHILSRRLFIAEIDEDAWMGLGQTVGVGPPAPPPVTGLLAIKREKPPRARPLTATFSLIWAMNKLINTRSKNGKEVSLESLLKKKQVFPTTVFLTLCLTKRPKSNVCF